MKDENSTKVCLTIKSHRGASPSVEQHDPKPLCIVPIQENVVSHKALLENYEGKLCEEQRPSTKRQLSAESAAKSVSVRKRSTVKKSQEEIVKPLSVVSPGTQSGRPYLPAVSSSQRKPRKLLFSSSDIFSKVDTFSIQKGREVTYKHTSLCFHVLINQACPILVLDDQRPTEFSSNLSQNTCLKNSSDFNDLDYLSSSVFNWDWSSTLQDNGPLIPFLHRGWFPEPTWEPGRSKKIPRSRFRTGPEALLVSNKQTHDVSRRRDVSALHRLISKLKQSTARLIGEQMTL